MLGCLVSFICDQASYSVQNPNDTSTIQEKNRLTEDEILIRNFLNLLLKDGRKSLSYIADSWQEWYIPMIVEVLYFSHDIKINRELVNLLEDKTGNAGRGYDVSQWHSWIWNQQLELPLVYTDFKSSLYGLIDPIFSSYFSSSRTSTIRLDEVRWGGVLQDGIPPLRKPKMISGYEASYLDENNIVFGIEVNGDARAYPKRILAWHEMFIDTVGNTPVCGVYCTLCGSMILFNTKHNGINHKLGTSGFLYRSNKLMYDKETLSLWNTLWGKPVIGPLAEKNIKLERLSVVTTTWSEWRRRHPKTTVLAPDTGYIRDYSEGAAYREYFSTDDLMFSVPFSDSRLKNKQEILGLNFSQHKNNYLAISIEILQKNPIYHSQIRTLKFVALTDESGCNKSI